MCFKFHFQDAVQVKLFSNLLLPEQVEITREFSSCHHGCLITVSIANPYED